MLTVSGGCCGGLAVQGAGCRRGPGGSRLAAGDCLAHCNRSLERPGLPWYQHRLEFTISIRPPLAIVRPTTGIGGTCARMHQQQRNWNANWPWLRSRASAAKSAPAHTGPEYHLRATATHSRSQSQTFERMRADIPAAAAWPAACVGEPTSKVGRETRHNAATTWQETCRR